MLKYFKKLANRRGQEQNYSTILDTFTEKCPRRAKSRDRDQGPVNRGNQNGKIFNAKQEV